MRLFSGVAARVASLVQLVALATGFVAILAVSAAAQGDVVSLALRERVKQAVQASTDYAAPIHGAIEKHYQERSFEPLWLKDGRRSEKATALLAALRSLTADGLEPEDYDVSAVEKLLDSQTALDLARGDFLLTRGLLLAAADLSTGRVNANAIDKDMSPVQRKPDYDLLLRDGAAHADPKAFFETLMPQGVQYPALKKALVEWREKARTIRYTTVPPVTTLLRPGAVDPRIAVIRTRLAETEPNVPEPGANGPNHYDDALVDAVKRYQEEHNLSVDGVIGAKTVFSLNIPIEERVQQVVVNLDRRRWAAETPGERFVMINAADYSMYFFDEGRIAFRSKVIVGKPNEQTPEITSTLITFQTNPYWTVPSSIAGKEHLPLLRRDPYALQKSNMRIFTDWSSDTELDPASVDWESINPKAFPYRIRQEPGPGNALGYIFFGFKNKYGIYMHDTASRFLFTQGSRNFSYGCIRLQNPFDFVEAAFKSSEMKARVAAAANSGRQASFGFSKPIDIHVTYQTVFADLDGKVQFRDDVYGRDRKVAAAMKRVRVLEKRSS
ncbi:MAG: L,D-transpeptidase family protein [Alphaproteobacteria bacterium]|nr:L,D-transpeptidase family protein [Alphaproteobacteria bacterium]